MSFKSFFLFEAEGITNRKPGDIFTDENDNRYKMEKLIKRPSEGKIFKNRKDLESDIQKQLLNIQKEFGKGTTVIDNNKKEQHDKSYMMMVLTSEDTGKPLIIIRYYSDPMTFILKWRSPTLLMPELKLKLYSGARRSGTVSTRLVSLSDIAFSERKLNTPTLKKLVETAYKKETKPEQKLILRNLYNLLDDIDNGGEKNYRLKDMKTYSNIFDVSLSELIVPYILLNIKKGKNKSLFSGESLNNLKNCIGKDFTSYSRLKIVFPTKANEKLIDSIIYDGEDKLFGISNKSGTGGAAASITNIIEGIEKIKGDKKAYKTLMKKYENEIKVLDVIKDTSAKEGPIHVAKILGLIDDKDVKIAMEAMKTNTVKKLTPTLKKMMYTIKADTQKSNYNSFCHLLTGIAKFVEKDINSNESYIELIKWILMQSKFVQVQTKFRTEENDLILNNIILIWPPVVHSLKVDTKKNYTSSYIRGKISFAVH